jgi:3-phenylpropionate/cinnamic acid dioxygenase small subunit
VFVSRDGAHHCTYTEMVEDRGDDYEKDGMRSAGSQEFRLEDARVLEQVDEFGDRVAIQILSLFPGFVLHQIRNSLAARQVVPKGIDRTELHWTLFGFVDDDEAMTQRRLMQANLVGPAGYISMEDGAATGFVQRGVAGSPGPRIRDRDGRRNDQLGRFAHHRDRGPRPVEGVAAVHARMKSGTAPDLSLQLAVERLHGRYAHALDADRLEEWPQFFTENGRYRIATAENEERGLPLAVLYAEGRAMMRDRVQSLRHANIYEPQRYRHMTSAVLVEAIDAGVVRSSANFIVLRIMQDGDTVVFASGRYVDRIVLREMQYEERVVICDSRRFDTLLAIPL